MYNTSNYLLVGREGRVGRYLNKMRNMKSLNMRAIFRELINYKNKMIIKHISLTKFNFL